MKEREYVELIRSKAAAYIEESGKLQGMDLKIFNEWADVKLMLADSVSKIFTVGMWFLFGWLIRGMSE